MLVLSRKIGEQLVIGDDVVVEVKSIHGRAIQLGIAAPPDVRVDRVEVRERIEADRAAGVMRQRDLIR